MSVANTTALSTQAANGVKTDFDFAFKIFLAADLLVYVETAVDSDVYTLQSLTEDYSLTFDTDAETGTVAFVTAPADGLNVKIMRSVAKTQPSVLPLEGKMPAKVIEDALDRITLIAQDINGGVISASGISSNVVQYAEGLAAAKPAAPTAWTHYYSTDSGQLELWVPTAGKWFLIG